VGDTVIWEREDGVAIVTLNRPEKFNALNPQAFADLAETLEAVEGDEGVKAIVMTGAGKGFCAGGDIEGHPVFTTDDPRVRERSIKDAQRITLLLQRMPKPVIAAVNGVATGAGLDLAMACDIRIASEEARFAEIFVRAAAMPDMGGTYLLPRLVGLGKALEMALTGDLIDAREALRIGLVNRVVPVSELMSAAKALARRLAQGPTQAQKLIKWAIHRALGQSLEEALDNEAQGQKLLLATEDVKEAARAFAEKRKPVFKGR